MNPTSGSFTINPRLQRHFCVFAVSFPGSESLTTIYQNILTQHYLNAEQKFNLCVTKLTQNIVAASLALHNKVAQIFLPTAIKFHYIFNLRDLSNIFQVRFDRNFYKNRCYWRKKNICVFSICVAGHLIQHSRVS